MLFKFLLITSLVAYVLYKLGSFFFRAGAASQQLRNFQEQQRKAYGANSSAKKSKSTKFDGGEYIDYEEIKK
jgi:flagellar biogenesis protein FliO